MCWLILTRRKPQQWDLINGTSSTDNALHASSISLTDGIVATKLARGGTALASHHDEKTIRVMEFVPQDTASTDPCCRKLSEFVQFYQLDVGFQT